MDKRSMLVQDTDEINKRKSEKFERNQQQAEKILIIKTISFQRHSALQIQGWVEWGLTIPGLKGEFVRAEAIEHNQYSSEYTYHASMILKACQM